MCLLSGCATAPPATSVAPTAAATPSVAAGTAVASAEQQAMEAKAVEYARGSLPHFLLLGDPTHVAARAMPLGEFNARLQGRASDCRDPATPVWLVVLHGRFQLRPSAPPKGSPGPPEETDRIWVLLSQTGDRINWGGGPVDLDAPPPSPVAVRRC